MQHENKDSSANVNPIEQQKVSSPEDVIGKKDALFNVESYSADKLTRFLIVERSPLTPDGETWPDSGWMLSGEGVHPKTGERIAKLEKLEYNEAGEIVYDRAGEPIVSVKYQPFEAALAYNEAQKDAITAAREQTSPQPEVSSTPTMAPEVEVEQTAPDAANPVRFDIDDAMRMVRYRTADGEARGIAVGYYYDNKGNMVDLIQHIDAQGAQQGEVAVLDGDVVVSEREQVPEVNEYDKLFDPSYELNYSAEDAAMPTPESEGMRLTRERRARDAEDAANKAYLRRKDGGFY